jgi:hypothetical protein
LPLGHDTVEPLLQRKSLRGIATAKLGSAVLCPFNLNIYRRGRERNSWAKTMQVPIVEKITSSDSGEEEIERDLHTSKGSALFAKDNWDGYGGGRKALISIYRSCLLPD